MAQPGIRPPPRRPRGKLGQPGDAPTSAVAQAFTPGGGAATSSAVPGVSLGVTVAAPAGPGLRVRWLFLQARRSGWMLCFTLSAPLVGVRSQRHSLKCPWKIQRPCRPAGNSAGSVGSSPASARLPRQEPCRLGSDSTSTLGPFTFHPEETSTDDEKTCSSFFSEASHACCSLGDGELRGPAGAVLATRQHEENVWRSPGNSGSFLRGRSTFQFFSKKVSNFNDPGND